MTYENKYRRASAHLLEQAQQELANGDIRQASEKGWGAAAQAVKAVSADRGWVHNSHFALFSAVRRLARETDNDELDRLFGVANSLHRNFYEDWLPAYTVRARFGDVMQFVTLMAEME